MQLATLVIVVIIVVAVFLVWRQTNPKIEGMAGSGGGLSTINALSWYDSPHHCWQGLYGDGEYCATNSALML